MGCFQVKSGLSTIVSCRLTVSAVSVLLMETHFLTLFISKLTVHLALAGNIYQSPLISSFPAFYHVPFGFTLAGGTFTIFLGGERSILLSYGRISGIIYLPAAFVNSNITLYKCVQTCYNNIDLLEIS